MKINNIEQDNLNITISKDELNVLVALMWEVAASAEVYDMLEEIENAVGELNPYTTSKHAKYHLDNGWLHLEIVDEPPLNQLVVI